MVGRVSVPSREEARYRRTARYLLRFHRGSLEGQRALLLERCHRRLEEHEHLGGALEGERLDAGGERPQACDQGGASGATVARVSA